jgi:predicted TIM-barrel fold metal-dependent hydrolase
VIFDFHARLAPGLVDALDEAGIERAAVCAGGLVDLDVLSEQIDRGGRSEARADNERVRQACGDRLVPFFFADPLRPDDYLAAASRFRGLEISPAVHGFRFDDPGVDALCETAAASRHPVYVVCLGRPGTRAPDLAALARRHPAVAFVSGHCGYTGLDASGLRVLADVPNVCVETSGCYTAVARLAVSRLGARRVLFGTEFPLQHPSVEIAKLRALGLSPADFALVASGNALRLLEES